MRYAHRKSDEPHIINSNTTAYQFRSATGNAKGNNCIFSSFNIPVILAVTATFIIKTNATVLTRTSSRIRKLKCMFAVTRSSPPENCVPPAQSSILFSATADTTRVGAAACTAPLIIILACHFVPLDRWPIFAHNYYIEHRTHTHTHTPRASRVRSFPNQICNLMPPRCKHAKR